MRERNCGSGFVGDIQSEYSLSSPFKFVCV
jgi:hypothetical protein